MTHGWGLRSIQTLIGAAATVIPSRSVQNVMAKPAAGWSARLLRGTDVSWRGRSKQAALVMALVVGGWTAPLEAQPSVMIFVSSDCPVSNRYAPEIQRLYHAFAPQGVRFQLVYPNPADSEPAIARHLMEYGYPSSIALRDPNHALAKRAQATITPEAAVFDNNNRLVYRGRIDDRFVELGRERPAATTHDLRDALVAVLSGKAVRTPRTQAVGCFIADMVGP